MEVLNIKLKKVAMHEIYKKETKGVNIQPNYSNQLEQLDEKKSNLLATRLIQALGRTSSSCEMDILDSSDESLLSIVNEMTKSSDADFVLLSKKVSDRLNSSQNTAGIPGGQIIVIFGTFGVESHDFICILKAEYTDGMRINNGVSSNRNVDVLEDIFLSNSTKLFKVGFFSINNPQNEYPDNWDVVVYDSNMSKDGSNASIYFYKSFLGCTFKKTSAMYNKKFFDVTKGFIEVTPAFSNEEKHELMNCLYNFMFKEKSDTFVYTQFSERYFDKSHWKNYEENIKHHEIPQTAIKRDTSSLEKKKRRRLQFKGNIEFSYDFSDTNVMIENINPKDDDSRLEKWTQIIIKSKILGEK